MVSLSSISGHHTKVLLLFFLTQSSKTETCRDNYDQGRRAGAANSTHTMAAIWILTNRDLFGRQAQKLSPLKEELVASTVVTDPLHISSAFALEVSALTDTSCLNPLFHPHTYAYYSLGPAPATNSGLCDFTEVVQDASLRPTAHPLY